MKYGLLALALVLAGAATAFADEGVNLRVHQGIWDSRKLTHDGEYFMCVMFETSGQVNFALCRQDPDSPYSAPILAEYCCAYILTGNLLEAALVLREGSRLALPLTRDVKFEVRTGDDTLTLIRMNGDRLFEGYLDADETAFTFGMFP